ncbi:MAG: hypothetical protein WD749_11405 [Phycisphaerales bacterium]
MGNLARHPATRPRRVALFFGVAVALACAAGPAFGQACSSIPTFEAGLAPTRQLHVATTGSNATGTGSAAQPYATIAFAAARATPGTAVVVHAGTYAGGGFINALAGTAEAPIWIGGAPGEPRPVLNGGSNGLQFSRARYVIIHDLEVQGATGNGLNLDDGGEVGNPGVASFLVLRNLSVHDIGTGGNNDALKLSGLYDFRVLDCALARAGGAASGSLIDMVGCHRGLIARCDLREASANAVQAKGGTSDVEVRWCAMTECGQRAVNIGGSTGLEFFRPPLSTTQPNAETRNIRVVSNVIHGATAAVAFVGAVDCIAANNTIITPHNWVLRILQETTSGGGYTFLPCGNNRFENNLVYFDRSDLSTYVNVGANTAPATFTFAHNLWYAYDNPAQSAPNLPVPETGAVIGQDPGLADPVPPPAGNYRINPRGPAAGAGRAPAGAAGDLGGRCYRTPPSIGAHEACYPNCDQSAAPPALNIADFSCFLQRFAGAEAYANCDRSATPPVLNIHDFSCFLTQYAAGCP